MSLSNFMGLQPQYTLTYNGKPYDFIVEVENLDVCIWFYDHKFCYADEPGQFHDFVCDIFDEEVWTMDNGLKHDWPDQAKDDFFDEYRKWTRFEVEKEKAPVTYIDVKLEPASCTHAQVAHRKFQTFSFYQCTKCKAEVKDIWGCQIVKGA